MNIVLNGSSYTLDSSCSIEDLLIVLKMQDKPVVVEWNNRALSPLEFSTTVLNEGDQVEIIAIVAGG